MLKKIKTIDEIKKGDLIIYRTGYINYVNHPNRYKNYYPKEFKNRGIEYWMDIMKIKRYVKILWFYKLKTIYVRKEK